MPDTRQHRGPHPEDARLFASTMHHALRAGVADLSWLLERGYSATAALKLVGDHHQLRERQRGAVFRAACPDEAADARRLKRIETSALRDRDVWMDGLNCIITLEAALSGGVLFRGRDGALRDLSSVHGTYRLVSETPRALDLMGKTLAAHRVRHVRVLIDRPVSNSGRLRAMIETHAQREGWPWTVELPFAPDKVLAEAGPEVVVATSDSHVIDQCGAWMDVAAAALGSAREAWVVDLSLPSSERRGPALRSLQAQPE